MTKQPNVTAITAEQYNNYITALTTEYKSVFTPARIVADYASCRSILWDATAQSGATLADLVGKAYANGIISRVLSSCLIGSSHSTALTAGGR